MYVTDRKVPQLGQSLFDEESGLSAGMASSLAAESETQSSFSWTSFLDNVNKAVDVGTGLYDKYVSKDSQNAALELAKINAETAAAKARAAELQARAATPTTTRATAGISTAMVVGGVALLGVAFFMSRKRR